MMAEYEVGPGLESGLGINGLIIGDHARDVMYAPVVPYEYHRVGVLLGLADIFHHGRHIFFKKYGDDFGREAGL